MNDPIINGKESTERIVNMEVHDGYLYLFLEDENGNVKKVEKNYYPWMLSSEPIGTEGWVKLKGNLHYQYATEFETLEEFRVARKAFKERDIYSVYNQKEAAMLVDGYTYFKGMKHKEVSVLAFDIETTGLVHDHTSKVLIISNTLRKGGTITRKLFCYDEYPTQAKLLQAWCDWVRETDPSIIIGHNILKYDIPYMNYMASKGGTKLRLGRNNNAIEIEPFTSKFRKGANDFLEYNRVKVYGREVIDTLFLSYKYDVGRKYTTYGLKTIIKEEGLEVSDRQFYDAGQIRHKYKDPIEWQKIKDYALHDADDALALFDLMSPPFFYLAQSVPKTFQQLTETASGSQINAVMIRSYLQNFHSIPKASESQKYEGAISIGQSGIYHNVFKVDVASLYPSIMIQWDVKDINKDPDSHFSTLVKTFTERRLEHKKKAKEDKYYDDLQNAEKIFINSCYGFLGTPGLHFNYPQGAAFITEKGREILTTSIKWATGGDLIHDIEHEQKWQVINSDINKFKLVNCDTDSISVCKHNFEEFTEEERTIFLNDLNSLFPKRIKFEDDGYYKTVIVAKAKNYLLWDGKKKKVKGSALKVTTKEKALKEFINEILGAMLEGRKNYKEIYDKYAKEIIDIKDISRWSSKKTVTTKVLAGTTTAGKKVNSIIQNKEIMEGDKIYTFFKTDGSLALAEDFNQEYDRVRLLKKLFTTTKTFELILDYKSIFPNYSLKRSAKLLDQLINGDDENV